MGCGCNKKRRSTRKTAKSKTNKKRRAINYNKKISAPKRKVVLKRKK